MSIVYLIAAVVSAFVLHLFIVYVQPLAVIFGLVRIGFEQWVLIFLIVIIGTILLDLTKIAQSKFLERSSS